MEKDRVKLTCSGREKNSKWRNSETAVNPHEFEVVRAKEY
jgi:hypothetical protein